MARYDEDYGTFVFSFDVNGATVEARFGIAQISASLQDPRLPLAVDSLLTERIKGQVLSALTYWEGRPK